VKAFGDISSINNKVLSRRNPIEQTSAGLVDTVGACLVKNPNLSCLCRPIACTLGFLTAVNGLDAIQPDKIKDRALEDSTATGKPNIFLASY
jgi:hypothetical protein